MSHFRMIPRLICLALALGSTLSAAEPVKVFVLAGQSNMQGQRHPRAGDRRGGGPVLLIKTAWGGKSLHKDFRPPGTSGETGPYYKQMLAEIDEALANIDAEFPALKGREPEIAGFI